MLYAVLRIAFALARYVSPTWRGRLGALGGEAFYWGWPAKRRNTVRNMAVVMGHGDGRGKEADGRRAAAAARASVRNYGRYMTEFFNLPNVPPREIVGRSHVQGWEHVDQALQVGKGALFVTGHFGLWDYASAVVADHYPGRVYVVAEPFSSPKIDALIQGQRAAQGITVIPMANVRAMVRALKSNNILGLLVDRPDAGDGVPVEFFGRPTMVPMGAATLAALTGAPILPTYFRGRPDGRFEGGILPPIVPPTTGGRAAIVRQLTQDIFTALEAIIRRSPTHWYMFRDMWGTALTPQPPLPDAGEGSGVRVPSSPTVRERGPGGEGIPL